MKIEHLQTSRLLLRKITPEVYDFVFKNYSAEELRHFFGADNEKVAIERDRVNKGMSTFNKSMLLFHLVEKSSGENFGWCGYHTWYYTQKRAELGYQIFDESKKKLGYMSEAISPVLDFGFGEMQLHRIEAFVAPHNTPSLKLMEKFGFTKEGHLREHYLKDGVHEDSVVFSLLRKEYLPKT